MKNSTALSKEFQVYKNGYFLYGRNHNGTCIIENSSLSDPIINSYFDKTLKFKQDTLYSCYTNMTFNQFYNFCKDKKWQNLTIFNMQKDIIFLGKYGSSEIDYKSVSKYISLSTFFLNVKLLYDFKFFQIEIRTG